MNDKTNLSEQKEAMTGKIVGYVRVSSLDQNPDRQLEGIKLDKVFVDKLSAQAESRPQLEAMLEFIREGDTVMVHSMDRLARNLEQLRAIVRRCTEQQVKVHFVKENLTFTGEDSPMSTLLLSLMGAFAEFERAYIRERQREGIALAKKRGVYKGRRKRLTAEQVLLLKQHRVKSKTRAELARDLKVCRTTLYKYLKEGQ